MTFNADDLDRDENQPNPEADVDLLAADPENPDDGEANDDWKFIAPIKTFRLPLAFLVDGELSREITIERMDGFCDDMLADSKGNKKERADRLNEVLSRCIRSIGKKTRPNGGQMVDEKKIPILPTFFLKEVERMPIQSRMLVIIRLRQLSVHSPFKGKSGHAFTYGMACPYCKVHTNLMTRLDLLPVVELPDAFCEETEHKFEHEGTTIVWRTLVGEDEVKMARASEQATSTLFSAMLYISVVTIDGRKPKRFEDLQVLSKPVRNGLQDDMDKGGVDVQVKNTCPNAQCKKQFMYHLPWRDMSFFFPSAVK